MKSIDITKPVMQKVVRFESRRTKSWLRRYAAFLFILGGILLASFIITTNQIIQFQLYDMFSLLQEDREIIAEFWQDTLATFFEELPYTPLTVAGIAIGAIVLVVLATRKKRGIIQKKLSGLAKYQDKGHNKR